ncbi:MULTISPECIES: terminase small subunit [unclassified Oceanobacillus]|uniref:terminase small subunit n=1 Tax=unclassified Oceanobacillus TaxID=2630292 RepID=UPI001BE7D9B3|nr:MULTISPECIES: terminase small subunit [unclassified Oceanobacillus]MBT2601408.1 terminase small subunit [Oceanobacillus sp. ISL-74]MBT2653315.1 terminase small subunit [Oceanobacillus sp. ISL-73]
MNKLTSKQRKFADEYIETGNATQSYINAGYSATKRTVAEANARKVLGNNSVKKYIEERMEELKSERVADQQEILEYYTRVMRGEELEEHAFTVTDKSFDSDGNMSMDERIETIKLEPKTRDKNKAAEMLGKRLAMWTDKQEIDVKGAVTFVDDIGDEDET